MAKISAKPMTNKPMVGVTIISIESGINLRSCFSKIDSNQTAKITPIIPPCPAESALPLKIFFNGASGFMPVSKETAPITPPSEGVAPNS